MRATRSRCWPRSARSRTAARRRSSSRTPAGWSAEADRAVERARAERTLVDLDASVAGAPDGGDQGGGGRERSRQLVRGQLDAAEVPEVADAQDTETEPSERPLG